ncbi:MAG: DHA2 family efflux MFS transporter permease subunit [Acetobacteraceae bacterium]|nr:DHA2 family efflux MFS transporter permease subunit [Acetobacteraceae bacterium]
MSDDIQVPRRGLLTASAMLAMFMQSLDTSICVVALPYMQGSLSASSEEITWVLTSSVIAAAIMTAPMGWMAQRFGRKTVYIVCLTGFVSVSMLCGAAQTLTQLVCFRLLQGIFGAGIAPLSQATMLDIYPFHRRAQAMALFSMGVTMGPMLGPTLGGYLTDLYSWRWVFYVNLPFGIMAVTGLLLFLPKAPTRPHLKFSWYGFAMLAIGVGAVQLVLDRGQILDWFTSREIVVLTVIAGLAFYLFVVHMCTSDRPFLPTALFKDRNFTSAIIMVFCLSGVMQATGALLAPYLQKLAGFPVQDAGWAMAPRGIGMIFSMFLASRLGMKVDQRKIMACGLLILGAALYDMSTWTPAVTLSRTMFTLMTQGFSIGLVFNPMTVMAYTSLSAQYRGDATAVQSLARNIGSAIGISVCTFTLTRGFQTNHAAISAGITPFERILQGHDHAGILLDPSRRPGAVLLDQMITYQAQIISYNNDFRLMTLAVLPPLLLLLLMRRHALPAKVRG